MESSSIHRGAKGSQGELFISARVDEFFAFSNYVWGSFPGPWAREIRGRGTVREESQALLLTFRCVERVQM